MNNLQIARNFGRHRFAECQIRCGDHAVHGGTDFMAHIGQKLTLGPGGGFGYFFCPFQFPVFLFVPVHLYLQAHVRGFDLSIKFQDHPGEG